MLVISIVGRVCPCYKEFPDFIIRNPWEPRLLFLLDKAHFVKFSKKPWARCESDRKIQGIPAPSDCRLQAKSPHDKTCQLRDQGWCRLYSDRRQGSSPSE